jgi:hypothetical protein
MPQLPTIVQYHSIAAGVPCHSPHLLSVPDDNQYCRAAKTVRVEESRCTDGVLYWKIFQEKDMQLA